MSDEPVVEYLRSRAQVRPPMDLVGSIADAVEGVPQQRGSWFAPFLPAAGAVAAAAVVAVAIVLLGQGPNFGPAPGGTPTQAELPSAAPSPTPPLALLEPGDTVTIDARDPFGTWGTITITRGEDVGGYEDGSVPPENFVVEIHVEYLPERQPDPFEFGAPDWMLADPGRVPAGEPLEAGSTRELTRPTLATYPGAIDIFANRLEGWLLFAVPRDAEDVPLDLYYRHTAVAEAATRFAVREPGPAPDPVAVAAPTPPTPVTFVEKDGYPFTVIDDAQADALFETPDTCSNPEDGYTVTYPDAWFSNTEVGIWPACSWFAASFYDVGEDPNAVPPAVAIVAESMEGDTGSFEENLLRESVTVGGRPAIRVEDRGVEGSGSTNPPGWHSYLYQVQLGSTPEEGPNLVFRTTTEMGGDYNLNKAVLDRIMALIEFDE